jgi:epsilon-lactone hydrolase
MTYAKANYHTTGHLQQPLLFSVCSFPNTPVANSRTGVDRQDFRKELLVKSEEMSSGTDPVVVATKASLRGRLATSLVRVIVKGWARGDPPAVVRKARRVFGLPNFAVGLYSHGVAIEPIELQDSEQRIKGEWIRPLGSVTSDKVILYLHGGGYVSCTPQTHRPITTCLARLARGPVFSLDYRLAPEHPFPAAVDDATAAFRWLVASGVSANQIAVAGDSAGGGLVLAMMLRLRSSAHALPGCGVCLAPWVDLTAADAYRNSGLCSMFQPADVASFAGLYLNGAAANSPEASPLFADLRGLPPLLIQVSSTELLLDDALRLHEQARRCGVACTLRVYPGLPHVWQLLTPLIPEGKLALMEIVSFIERTWKPTDPAGTASINAIETIEEQLQTVKIAGRLDKSRE